MLLLPFPLSLVPLSLLLPSSLASSPPASSSPPPPPSAQFSFSLAPYSPSSSSNPPPPLRPPSAARAAAPRPLTGRFLHLTDLHPDPYYREGASEDEACHFKAKKKKKKHRGKKGKHGGKGVVSEEVEEGEDGEDDTGLEVRGKKDKKEDKPRTAGYWGLPVSDCDTPLTLLNSTFDWLAANFRDRVDFVVWTGDNARHDIDTRLPRSLPEIFDLNTYVVDRLRAAFGDEVTIVGSIGNNDIYPHNVMFPGPSKITSTFLSLWTSRGLIPEHHAHTFARGGYYSVSPSHPLLHDKLLLVSLNTIYFYARNTVVDGCPPFDEDVAFAGGVGARERFRASILPSNSSLPVPHPSSPSSSAAFSSLLSSLRASSGLARELDPGTEQLLWLEQQLVLARAGGMQVWLTGHVPPGTPGGGENWYAGCGGRYGELVREFGGTVVGQLFGHMNVDHFTFLTPPSSSSSSSSSLSAADASSPADEPSPLSSVTSAPSLPDLLFGLYRSLPSFSSSSSFFSFTKGKKHKHKGKKHKKGEKKANLDDYAVVHVNPSVVPTYAPAVRVWEYNISAPGDGAGEATTLREKGVEKKSGGWWKRWFTARAARGEEEDEAEKEDDTEKFADAPSRRNQFLTPLAFTQYFLPDSRFPTTANETASPAWEVEYTTLSPSSVARRLLASLASLRSLSSLSSSPFSAADPLLLPASLPAALRTWLASPTASRPRGPHAELALRRVLRREGVRGVMPYEGFFEASSSSSSASSASSTSSFWGWWRSKAGEDGEGEEGGKGKDGLVLSEWVRLARWLTAKEGGGKDGERWRGVRGRMGVGTGEI
ncbi:hypothetical protein JCM6882_000103 [Rhodosporidiobolus microsporus]